MKTGCQHSLYDITGLFLLIPSDGCVEHYGPIFLSYQPDNTADMHHPLTQNSNDNTEINPVSKTSSQDYSDLHDVEDRSSEIPDDLEELVLLSSSGGMYFIVSVPRSEYVQ